jgi:hypothetical protein
MSLSPGPARTRPLGTAHALLVAAPRISGPFAVLNADDYYGRPALSACSAFLAGPVPAEAEFAVVGYALADTASDAGGVNRGLLGYDENLDLESVVETSNLQRRVDGRFEGQSAAGHVVCEPQQLVSMNLWAFRPAILPLLGEEFDRFLAENADPSAELQLAQAMDRLLKSKRVRGRVLAPASQWCGLTFPDDRQRVSEMLAAMVARGEYPEVLWS